MSSFPSPGWVELANGVVPLRCWWAPPQPMRTILIRNSCDHVHIVLPEGVWCEYLGPQRGGSPGRPRPSALALPLFSRTAPDLELAYESSIWPRAGATRTPPPQIKSSAMSPQHSDGCGRDIPKLPFIWWASASGGMPPFWRPRCQVFDFYGAGVSRMRPSGGEPSLNLLPEVQARLTRNHVQPGPLSPLRIVRRLVMPCAGCPAGQRLRCGVPASIQLHVRSPQ